MDFPTEMLEALKRAYRVPARVYHSWSHVEEVVRWIQQVPAWTQPREVMLAALFHDAVYVPGAKDNEERSAQLALELLKKFVPDADAARVVGLVRLTARHGTLKPADVDAEAALFLDCDMAILGAAPDVFDRYGDAIREEYCAVPSVLYAFGRKRFLKRLLDSPRIFLSDFFHARLDSAARSNVRRALA